MVPLADVVVVLVCGVPVLMSCVSCIDGLGVCVWITCGSVMPWVDAW